MTQFLRHSQVRRRVLGLAVVVAAGAAAAAYGLTAAPGAAYAAQGGQAAVDRALTPLPNNLTVVVHDGYLTAQGPAAEVRDAAKLFAGIGDIAVFGGNNETGTGTLTVAVAPPDGDRYVELQTADADISSVENNYSDTFGIYNASGKLVAAIPANTTENLSSSGTSRSAHAASSTGSEGVVVGSPGLTSGNTIQVPVHIPVNVCGNTIDVIGVLNPAFGNTCVNS